MKHTLTAILLFYFHFFAAQEIDTPLYLQKPLQIDYSGLKKALDSLALEQLNSDFYKENLNSFNNTLPINDSSYTRIADSIRMRSLFGSYSDFKRKLLALDLNNDIPEMHFPKFIGYNSQYGDINYAGTVGVSFMGPVSALYNAFSKEEQSRRKYYALKEFEPSQKKINAKYNLDKVQRWTGLKDDKLTKFVLYCHFDDDYLLHATDYELIEMVMNKLIEFKAINDSCNYEQ